MKCCLYLRVSTDRQTVENQRTEVAELACNRGFEVVATYVEEESAARYRPEFQRMMADARRGKFKVIVAWSLDRLGRGFSCFDAFRDLSGIGVNVVTVREPWTEAEGPARDLLVAVMSWVSGFERDRLVERINAGLARARREGKTLGRPRTRPARVLVARLRETGMSWAKVAARLGCSQSAARRAMS